MLEAYPGIFAELMRDMRDDRTKAITLHNHYADIAANMSGQGIDTECDNLARQYLDTAISVDRLRVGLVQTIATKLLGGTHAKGQIAGPQPQGGSQTAVQINEGGVAIFGGQPSRRELLASIRSKHSDKARGFQDAIPQAPPDGESDQA